MLRKKFLTLNPLTIYKPTIIMSNSKQYGQNMRIFTSYWGTGDTFKLMPVTDDCPYAEVIYDVSTTLLVVISKIKKNNLQLVEKLDDHGNPVPAKKPKRNNKPWMEKQIQIEVLQEYYITEKSEQEEFIKLFAINAEEYDYSKFLRDVEKEANAIHIPEQMPLVNENGQPLKVTK